ncbi:MAG TPA: histidine--tRNA ligase, partial [Spirochaetia bacterium]|nr:histidine--tRNA ligase [Spirochaetia bacterium]
DQEAERQRIMNLLGRAFGANGFVPIDTPILEYTEILLGKGGGDTDKQIYRFEDQGGRDVAMRYDLTVPFARFMAAHLHELYLPFKRFHMGKAFRGENTQRGRYREFVQCDFDIVGTTSASADFEIVLMIDRAFRTMGVDGVRVHFAHRGVFNALLESLAITEGADEVLRIVDKLRKIGEQKVRDQLTELIGSDPAEKVLTLVSASGTNAEILATMKSLVPGAAEHTDRIEQILTAAEALGLADRLALDPSITRGLDYYTGIVFETFLVDLPAIGSVCSGGRYDNLAGLYTKEQLPGVGASIGLDRLMAGLEELGLSALDVRAADAIVLCLDAGLMAHYHAVAEQLRAAGLRAEVFPDQKKLGQQFSFAEKKGIPAAILCGEAEHAVGAVNVRDLTTRTNTDGISVETAIDVVRGICGAGK